MRKLNFDDLQAMKNKDNLFLTERFSRMETIRRKPRDPVEEDILRNMIIQKVSIERKEGRIVKVNGRIRIKVI